VKISFISVISGEVFPPDPRQSAVAFAFPITQRVRFSDFPQFSSASFTSISQKSGFRAPQTASI
jgi:hypothetical protein